QCNRRVVLELHRARQLDAGDRPPQRALSPKNQDPAAAGFASFAARAAAVAFAQREQVILTALAHDGQSLEAGVALLEREVHPAAPLELRRFVALVDLRLEGAVRVLLGFDQQVEAARARVPRDVLVPVALARATEPAVRLPSGLEAAMDPRHAADVVEDDVVVRALGDHAAGLEHAALGRRLQEIRQLVLLDQPEDSARAHGRGRADHTIGSATNGMWAKNWTHQRKLIVGGRCVKDWITTNDITL